MINPRKIATLGIGFGSLAIAAIGLIPDTQVSTTPDLGGGGGFYSRSYQLRKKEPFVLPVPIRYAEEDDEEAVILFLLTELRRRDYI